MKSTDDVGVDFSSLPALPKSWSWCVPADICRVVASGTTPPPDEMFEEKGEVPFIKVYNLTHTGLLDFTVKPTFISRSTHEGRLARSKTHSGDVLINIVGPPLGKVSMVPDDHPEWNVNQAIVVFRPESGISRKYIKYAFLNEEIMSRVTNLAKATAGQSNIGVSMCRNRLPIPLSPEKEQVRIVAKIEELFSDLDAGVAYLTRVRSNLKRYRAAVLKAAVEGRLTENWRAKHSDTEPAPVLLDRILTERRRKWEEDQLAKFAQSRKQPPKDWREKYREPYSDGNATRADLPPTWCWVSMDQLLGFLRNGLPQKPTGPPSGHRILRINAVRPMKVDLDEVRYFEDLPAEAESYWIEEGDLLFTRYNGSVELLGVSGLVRGCDQPTLHPDKLIRVKTVLNGPLPFFAEIASNVGKSRKHMERRARTTAGQTGISGTDIREMPVPLPPLDEQKQIIIEVERHLSLVDKIEAQVEANLKRASRLRQGILKRAFEGRLVPQDPNDEPADQLLDRVREQRQSAPPATNASPRSQRPGRPRKSGSATPLFAQDEGDDQGGES